MATWKTFCAGYQPTAKPCLSSQMAHGTQPTTNTILTLLLSNSPCQHLRYPWTMMTRPITRPCHQHMRLLLMDLHNLKRKWQHLPSHLAYPFLYRRLSLRHHPPATSLT